jgi:hypothetical protein
MSGWQMTGFGIVGLLSGLVVGAVKLLNDDLDAHGPRHRDFQMLEDYNGELVAMVLDVGIMKGHYAPDFFGMHHGLIQLLTLSANIHRVQRRMSWTQAASSYHYDVDVYADALLAHVHEYPTEEAQLRKNLKTIKGVAAALSKNIAATNDEIHSKRLDPTAFPDAGLV